VTLPCIVGAALQFVGDGDRRQTGLPGIRQCDVKVEPELGERGAENGRRQILFEEGHLDSPVVDV
jgi:hypothetical protein